MRPRWDWLVSAAEMAAAVGSAGLLAAPVPVRSRDYPRVATRTPGPGADSIRAARDFTAGTLRRWGIGDRRDDIVVVVSELLTNALRHARPAAAAWPCSPVRLGLLQPGPCVLCAVADPSDQVPEPREPDWCDESGRGLHVVASLSDRWGCTPPTRRGKVVWATFATGGGW
jgi:hypothetical protein